MGHSENVYLYITRNEFTQRRSLSIMYIIKTERMYSSWGILLCDHERRRFVSSLSTQQVPSSLLSPNLFIAYQDNDVNGS